MLFKGGGNGNWLQYSCLENPVDRGAWWAAVHGVTQSQTWLKRLSSSSSILCKILFPFRLLDNIEQSSLCYTVGPCWLSILNVAVCTCQSPTFNVFLPFPLPTRGLFPSNCYFLFFFSKLHFQLNKVTSSALWCWSWHPRRKRLSAPDTFSVCTVNVIFQVPGTDIAHQKRRKLLSDSTLKSLV